MSVTLWKSTLNWLRTKGVNGPPSELCLASIGKVGLLLYLLRPVAQCKLHLKMYNRRPAIHEESFDQLLRQACDEFDAEVEALLDDTSSIYTDSDDAAGASLNDHNGATYTADEPVVTTVGDATEVFWTDDNQFYSGTMFAVKRKMYAVGYDDADQETLNMANKTWRFASAIIITDLAAYISVVREEPQVLDQILVAFGNKPFMRHAAQEYFSFVLINNT